ncbi:hypothetical protein MK489_02475 [Myxococcota bacterium]|nr:hypothetical protein [Myxococcota bacterium]
MEALRTAKDQLVPLLQLLEALLEADAVPRQFFVRIREMIELAKDDEDLAGPFMELSTTAFRGFEFDLDASALIDQILLIAQRISARLSEDPPLH